MESARALPVIRPVAASHAFSVFIFSPVGWFYGVVFCTSKAFFKLRAKDSAALLPQ